MFEELKNLVNLQNIQKIKANQRYFNNESYHNHHQSSSQDQFQNQLNNRKHNFHLLTDLQIDQGMNRTKDYQREQIAKYRNQKELIEEKLKIDQQLHQKQLEYLSQKYQRQINTLKAEIEKYQYSTKMHIKQQGAILSLKKDNRYILQLHQQDKKIIERLSQELSMSQRQNMRLKMIIRNKQEEESQLKANQYIESENEQKLKQQINALQQQQKADKQRKKHLQSLINKLRIQNQDLQRLVDKNKFQFDHQISQIRQKQKGQFQRLQNDYKELKKRNQLIEDSFIDHLTQTSLNLQNNIKSIPDRTVKNNSSLDLQDSPIRARSKDRSRGHILVEEDPEKRTNQCKCSNQINKLRIKLEQANSKIVQLIREKCYTKTKTNAF